MTSKELPTAGNKFADDNDSEPRGECCSVTLNEAEQGITKVIRYLKDNVLDSEDQIQTLLRVMEHMQTDAIRPRATGKQDSCQSKSTMKLNTREQNYILPDKPEEFDLMKSGKEFMNHILDVEVAGDLCDENRALNTLPGCLAIKRSTIQKTDIGAFTDIFLQENTCFGPYQGEIVESPDTSTTSRCFWQISTDCGKECYIDGQNPTMANWMRYVHCTSAEKDHNLQAFQHMEHIYYRATKDIEPGTELVVCYQYSQGDNEDVEDVQLFLDDEVDLSSLANNHNQVKDDSVVIAEECYCDKCGLGFGQALYHEHMKMEHKDDLKSKSQIEQSSPTVRLKKKPNILCGKKKKAKAGSLEEQACFDINTGKYICPFCSQTFNKFSKFHYHRRKHTGEKPFQCVECGRCFIMKGHLRTHELTHSKIKPHACAMCNREFSQLSNLKRHMRIHTGEKPHQCNHCGKKFSDSSTFKCHVRIHTGERPYKCDHCSKCFKSVSACQSHASSHLKPDRECDLCHKTFRGKLQLKQHMKYHGVALQCPKCQDTFKGKSKLDDHMRNTCGIELRCCKCKKVFIGMHRLEEHMKLHFAEKL